jgi:NADPH:quinone reductase-like Zn-dependent oxidoreductase
LTTKDNQGACWPGGARADLAIMDLMMKDASIHGFTIFRPFASPALLAALVDVGLDHAEALRPLVAKTFELAEAPQALDEMEGCAHLGKLALLT